MDSLSLKELWNRHTYSGRLIDKWEHYLPIYERHFAQFRNKPVRILEIGVSHGGSLQLWKAYFGWNAQITGLDIDKRCAEYGEIQIYVYTGDQGNLAWMNAFAKSAGPFDIVIDDGSHKITDQQISFCALWPHTTSIYLIEDIHGDKPHINPQDAASAHYYPWVMVFERDQRPMKRIVTGKPSRQLNHDEISAYGPINDQYLHPHL